MRRCATQARVSEITLSREWGGLDHLCDDAFATDIKFPRVVGEGQVQQPIAERQGASHRVRNGAPVVSRVRAERSTTSARLGPDVCA